MFRRHAEARLDPPLVIAGEFADLASQTSTAQLVQPNCPGDSLNFWNYQLCGRPARDSADAKAKPLIPANPDGFAHQGWQGSGE
jgi:hypothetical protein